MFYYYRQILVAFSLVLMCGSLMSNAIAETNVNQQPRSIRVSGTGKTSVKPDKADLTLSVEVQAKTAETARNQAAMAMDALIKAVKNTAVADKDIQTRSVSLYPNYAPDTANKIIGYQLTNQVIICIRDVNKASDVIDSAVKAGGNTVRVQGISFAVENAEAALAKARDKAYANAKMKAEQYAQLAGLSLGHPLQISEGSDASPMPAPYGERMMMKAAADSAETPVQPGEQDVTVNVDIVFGIQ
jgi:uncharacterized protein